MLPGRALPRAPPSCCGPSRHSHCPPILYRPCSGRGHSRLSPLLPAQQLLQRSKPAPNIFCPALGACLLLTPRLATLHRLILTQTRLPARVAHGEAGAGAGSAAGPCAALRTAGERVSGCLSPALCESGLLWACQSNASRWRAAVEAE